MSHALKKAFHASMAGLAIYALVSNTPVSGPANAAPPPVGSDQWQMFKDFGFFFSKLKRCCGPADGRGDLKEKPIRYDQDGNPIYEVLATREAFGPAYHDVIPPEGLWVTITWDKIIKEEEVARICREFQADTTIDKSAGCRPEQNILWIRQGDAHIYCFLPRQLMGSLPFPHYAGTRPGKGEAPLTGGNLSVAALAPQPAP